MTNNNLINEYKDKFNDATFCWNGDNKLGADFAKKKNKEMQKFISNLLTKKDQEHKAELEMIKGEIKKAPEAKERVGEIGEKTYWRNDIVAILDSHINKLSTE